MLKFRARWLPEPLPPAGRPLSTEATEPRFDALAALVEAAMPRHVGLAVGVTTPHGCYTYGAGPRHIDDGKAAEGDVDDGSRPPSHGIDASTPFEIGSMTKVFTGLLLAAAELRREIDLDAPIATVLPQLNDADDDRVQRITWRHLATHTAGVARMPAGVFLPSNLWQIIRAGDCYGHYDVDRILRPLLRGTLSHDPGSAYRYSNLGFAGLGLALTRVLGTSLGDALRHHVTGPLGMQATHLGWPLPKPSAHATGHRSILHWRRLHLFQVADHWSFPEPMAAAGGITSTLHDLLRFTEACLSGEASALSAALKRSMEVHYRAGYFRVGLAWGFYKLRESGYEVCYHNGATGGFRSYLAIAKEPRCGVVVLGNATPPVDGLAVQLLKAVAHSAASPGG